MQLGRINAEKANADRLAAKAIAVHEIGRGARDRVIEIAERISFAPRKKTRLVAFAKDGRPRKVANDPSTRHGCVSSDQRMGDRSCL